MKDNYNNNNSEGNGNNDNKEIKFNYFGGTFGERQKSNGVSGISSTSSGGNGPNDHNSRKNSQINANNNNNNYNYKSHHLSTDFGTVSDANKKGYNKEENGNTIRVTTSPTPRQQPSPVVVTLSTTATDSEQYHSKPQPFPSNGYPYDRLSKPVIQSQDFNRNTNNRITYESNHSEQYSTAPDKSYLMPPPASTESPSSATPYKSYTNVRHSPVHTPVHTLPAGLGSRTGASGVKWHNKKQNTDSYVTERVRSEPTTVPPPPPPPRTSPPRAFKPGKEEYSKKTMDNPIDWPHREYSGNYEPSKYVAVHHQSPSHQSTSAQPPKNIHLEQIEISHPNWSPVGQTVHTFSRQTNKNQKQMKPSFIPPASSNWNNPAINQEQKQGHKHSVFNQEQPEQEHFEVTKEQIYTYPAVHHTIEPSLGIENTLWSSDDRPLQQLEPDYRPVKNIMNSLKNKNSSPLKPKWAQDMMSEMDDGPQIQALAQQLMPQSSHPQDFPNMRTGHKNKNNLQNRKALKLPNYDLFGNQPAINGYDFGINDYFGLKAGTQPMIKQQNSMNFFYDQFKPYSFAENNPTEYVKKLTESEKQLITQSLEQQNEEQNKENIKTQSQFASGLTFPTKSKPQNQTPTLVEELKMEKDQGNSQSNSQSNSYVPDILPDMMAEEEYSMVMPETHIVPKLHQIKPQKSMSLKHNPNRYTPGKHQFMTSNLFDDFLSGDNSWVKHLDTSGLEAAFSHNYPILPMSLPNPNPNPNPNPRPKKGMKVPKSAYSTSMVTHLTPPHRFILGAPLPPQKPNWPPPGHVPHPHPHPHPHQAFYLPQPMPFPNQFAASMPFPYYIPQMGPQQRITKNDKTIFKNSKKQSKTKQTNNSPKFFKF